MVDDKVLRILVVDNKALRILVVLKLVQVSLVSVPFTTFFVLLLQPHEQVDVYLISIVPLLLGLCVLFLVRQGLLELHPLFYLPPVA